MIDSHTVVTDAAGKLIPWVGNPDGAYAQVLKLNTDFLLTRTPNDSSTGTPAYLSQSYLNPDTLGMAGWPHNPAGLYSMLTESGLGYAAYAGDPAMANLAKTALDTQLATGMTKATDDWASVPYASGNPGSLVYGGASRGDTTGVGDGTGVIEPDKIGEEGLAFARMYEYSGDSRYLSAAVKCADALAVHTRTGTVDQSPWPFRVYAGNGVVREQYSANVIAPIALFDELIRIGAGTTTRYQSARATAWTWLMNYPMKNNVWANYFEDVAIQPNLNNINSYIPLQTARYLLENPAADPNWESHARALVAWVKSNFGASSNGATIIKEQNAFSWPMGSHTARYASVNALLYEKTGDLAAKEEAYRSFNWATYMVRSSGVTIDGPNVNNMWFTDGYGDFVRHFMVGMGAVPAWAASGEARLLRSSSVVRTSTRSASELAFTTFDRVATDVLHVPWSAVSVTADGVALQARSDLTQDGYVLDSTTGTLRIKHSAATQIRVARTAGAVENASPQVSLTSPVNGDSFVAPATILFAANASDADGKVTQVDFLSGGAVVATATAAPWAAAWENVPAGTASLTARVRDDKGATTLSPAVTVSVLGPTSQWADADIGTVGVAGSSSLSGGTFTVEGSGDDIWSNADSFHFTYRQLNGDGEIRARVATQQSTDPWALAGLMIRESLAPGSPHALVAVTPSKGLSFTYRPSSGATSGYVNGGSGAAPYWLRLVRAGSTLTAFKSTNGSTWTQYGSTAIGLSASLYVGLAVTSHVNTTLAASTFDNVLLAAAGADTSPPIISAINVPAANPNGATVNWTTDEPSTSQVEYGTTTSYGQFTAVSNSLVTSHSLAVAGLDSGKTYHFRVKSADTAGNLATSPDSTFTTQSAPDTTPPTVSITTPVQGATISGSVSVTAAATDDRGVSGVQLLIDGVPIGSELTTSPFTFTWDTTGSTEGTHAIAARARDAAGNIELSAAVTATVRKVALPAGLVVSLGFNEGSGTRITDSSGLGNDGVASGAPTWAAGKYGKAMSFNGATTVVTIADSDSLDLTTAVTISAWVKPTTNESWRTIALKEITGGLSYGLYSSDGSRPAFYGHVTTDVSADGNAALTTTNWSHVVGTYDGTTLRIYVNGVLAGTQMLTGSLATSTGALRIGGNSVWGEYFSGLIDEVRIYNKALSQEQVSAIMAAPINP